MKIVFRYYPHNAENVIIMTITRIYQRKNHYRTGSHQTETVYSEIFKKTKTRENKVGKTVRKIRTEKNKLHGTFHVA